MTSQFYVARMIHIVMNSVIRLGESLKHSSNIIVFTNKTCYTTLAVPKIYLNNICIAIFCFSKQNCS